MAFHRWLYRTGRPNLLAKFLNRGWAFVHAAGVAPNYLVTLEVVGRQSGKSIRFPLAMIEVKGERYLVSMLGAEANWVRNVKAADGQACLYHGRTEEVHLTEIEASQRPPILKSYLRAAHGTRPHIPVSKDAPLITIRAAALADLPALVTIKGADSEAMHRDRLGDAQDPSFRYLVLVAEGTVIGFACLVMRRPAYWSDGQDTTHLPQIVDLQVAEAQRGRGYGTAFIRAMEQMAVESGYDGLYISVEPVDNPQAYALYRRLGYQPLQTEPYPKRWTFTDSAGTIHQGDAWVVDMRKELATA